ncbi:MAG: DNA methyltransferase, partial [Bdellovibrionota bacterium]
MQRALEEVLQRIRHPERDRDALHALFSYPAKFQATVPTLILQYFSSAGDLVLDPYGGGGTTAACCRMTGRNSVHLDLNPLSCLVALAKTTRLRHADVELAILLLARAKKPARPSLLTAEETVLFGPSVSEAAEIAFAAILRAKAEKNPVAPVLACLLIKCLKLCGRRDAVARRGKPASEHLGWIQRELRTLHTKTEGIYPFEVRHRIRCGSNHETGLGRASVSLIITS